VHAFELLEAQGQADAVEVDRLAAAHAARAGRLRQQAQHGDLARGRQRSGARRVGAGEHPEGLGLQRVADQQRRRFVIRHVHGRFAAAQRVVVHAGHVVVHQRIGVDHLQRAGGTRQCLRLGPEQGAAGVDQQRTHALAAAEHGVAHRLVQLVRDQVRRRADSPRAHPRPRPARRPSRLRTAVAPSASAPLRASPAPSALKGLSMSPSSTLTWDSTFSSWAAQNFTSSEPRA
jgi:hypothetical protein